VQTGCEVLPLLLETPQPAWSYVCAPTPWQEIQINYTVATGSAPDVKVVGTNCGNSRVLLENYKRDRVDQDVRQELEETRAAITRQQQLVQFWDHVGKSRAIVSIDPDTSLVTSVLPPSPSPPPPPPPVAHNAPPAPPEQVSNAVEAQRVADDLVALEVRRDSLVASLDNCYVPDRPSNVVCGLSKNEAPDPWMALHGVKCRGYDTRSAREEDFCGYWNSDANPMAADRKLRDQLLREGSGPYCIAESGGKAECSSNATRTQRSGMYDLKYMVRDDRRYCEMQFARERLAPESGADIETCRTNLTARIERCELTCDSCGAECTSKAARNLVSSWRCSAGLPVMGTYLAMSVSDQGQDIKNRWGSIRQRGLIGTPDESWVEQYRTLVQNSVDRPRIARNSVSCRKSHVESTTGGFQSALNGDGAYIQRTGFMVGCNTDLDCYSRCGGLKHY
jgi:hypothetical protein